jgi:hypothetical protein
VLQVWARNYRCCSSSVQTKTTRRICVQSASITESAYKSNSNTSEQSMLRINCGFNSSIKTNDFSNLCSSA